MTTTAATRRTSGARNRAPATFTARALDPKTGKVTVEKVDATDESEVRAGLEMRGLTPLAVKAAGRGWDMEIPGMTKRVKPDDLAVFARMFATMISAGMNVLRALTVLTHQTENPTLAATLEKVTASVQGGKPLSGALAEHPRVFPPLMVSMVHAGEVGGFLETAMREVAESTEADVHLRAEIKSASTYPAVVSVMGVLGAIGMLLFIVPVFTSMFADLGGELPLPTRIAVGLSDVLKVVTLPAIPVIVALVVWWRRNKNTERVRRVVDPVKLRLPVFGPLIRKLAIVRFARNLSVMLSSGVQMLSALDVVSETAGNTVVRDAVRAAAEHVKHGQRLSDHLGDGGVFPDMIVQMVSVGEESGAVSEMLAKIAQFYDQQIESTTKRLASLLEPILIVGMGAMLGGLIVAMYLPTFEVFNLIQ